MVHFGTIEFILPTVVLGLIIALLLYLLLRVSAERRKLYLKYKPVVDLDREAAARNAEIAGLQAKTTQFQQEYDRMTQTLRADYDGKHAIYDKLLHEISVLEESMDFISFGLYKPHYSFDTSEKYKEEMDKVVERQKAMIRAKSAITCETEWTVSGSKREGQRMTNQNMKLMMRAFNGECDAAVVKVKWDNAVKMEERITKAFEAINQLGSSNRIHIADAYLKLEIEELRLAHEYQERLHEEKEEQRRIREQMREEEKVQQEIERAKRDAEDEEKRYQKALEKAKKELEKTQGEAAAKLNEEISALQQQLQEALEKKERAISRAQETKSGHVYVISNIGSFGEGVFKVGMTRRLEPLDRVHELGDASVPFEFDVHAMVYSDNAPDLEYRIQKVLEERRVNLVNNRKEFFSVGLVEIERIVAENHATVEFTKIAEAREYRESVAIREEKRKAGEVQEAIASAFPASL